MRLRSSVSDGHGVIVVSVCEVESALLLALGGLDLSWDGKKSVDELMLFSEMLLAAKVALVELSRILAMRRSILWE